MFRRSMRYQCMGKKNNLHDEFLPNTNGLIPQFYVLHKESNGTFTFDATPEEKKALDVFNQQLKADKEAGKITQLDINRTSYKVINKFVEPFSSYAEMFINAQKGRGNSPQTIKHYQQTIKKMGQFFFWLWCNRRDFDYSEVLEAFSKEERAMIGSAMPFAILEDVEFDAKFREFLLDEEEVSEQTVATYFRDYRAIAYFGMDEGLIEKRAITVKTVYSDPKEVYTEEELDKLLKKPAENATFAEYRDWAIINWVLATGNRIGTVINVKISDVDFQDNMITVSKQKNKKLMRIPMIRHLRDVMKFYINEFLVDEDGEYVSMYLFPASYTDLYNQPMSRISLSKSIARYNKSRGVKKTSFHLFRHTFVKKWIVDGGPLPELQRILGHSTLDMVVHYANLYSDDLRPKMEDYSILATHKAKTRGRMIQRRKH